MKNPPGDREISGHDTPDRGAAVGIKQDMEALFFGSGVQELYEHWQSDIPGEGSIFHKHGEWEPGQAPDFWAYKVTVTDPLDTEELLHKVITYSVLHTAASMIGDHKTDTSKPFHPASAETEQACANLVYGNTLEGFDPYTIDEVLQVAVYGGIWHPHFRAPRKGRRDDG